jgi:hypothetical protein
LPIFPVMVREVVIVLDSRIPNSHLCCTDHSSAAQIELDGQTSVDFARQLPSGSPLKTNRRDDDCRDRLRSKAKQSSLCLGIVFLKGDVRQQGGRRACHQEVNCVEMTWEIVKMGGEGSKSQCSSSSMCMTVTPFGFYQTLRLSAPLLLSCGLFQISETGLP